MRVLPLALVSTGLLGCRTMLPVVAEVPTQDTSDWRVPAAEWDALHQELLRCRRDLGRLAGRYSAQQQAFITYNTMSALTGLTGASTAIAGTLQAAGADSDAVNKALGITGAVVAAGGPILFSLLSNQQAPAEARASFDKMNTAYVTVLHARARVLYCQALIVRTPEVLVGAAAYPPEVIADRARFRESCAPYYAAPAGTDVVAQPAPQQEPPPRGEDSADARKQRARRVVDPEFQLARLTEQLRQQCTENPAQPVNLQPAPTINVQPPRGATQPTQAGAQGPQVPPFDATAR